MAENWMDSATEFTADSLAGVSGNSVVYEISGVFLPVKATIDTTSRGVVDANGAGVVFTAVDFLIRAKRLVANGVSFAPNKTHKIHWTRQGVTEIYSVLMPPGEECYRPEDQFGLTFRVHTKLMG